MKGEVMMRNVIFLVFILVLLANPWEMRGQQTHQRSSTSVSQMPTTLSLLFNRVLIYRREGGPRSGLLVGVESNALIIRVGKKDEKLVRTNLAKVIIETEKKTSRNVLYSMLIGTYLHNLIVRRAKNQPKAYRDKMHEGAGTILLGNVLSAGMWGGLGYLASSIFEKDEKVFNFNGSEEIRNAEWDRLRRYVIGEHSPKKVHLSVQAGHVFTRVSSSYKILMQNAGYGISGYSYLIGEYREEASDFNMLRKLQLTYSFKSEAEIGVALFFIGEPSISGYKYQKYQIWDSSGVEQILDATGYYAIGIYKPFLKRMPKRTAWNVGVGIGLAKVEFNLKAHTETWDPYTEVTTEHNISNTSFSGVVFTELKFHLQDSLVFGLTADYVFVPAANAPNIPEAGIPAQKLRFGNGSIGFTLGLDF
jgi:hypothetical protein